MKQTNVNPNDNIEYTVVGNQMALFDSLPLPLRRCIADAPYEYDVSQIFSVYREYVFYDLMSALSAISEIEHVMRREVRELSHTKAEWNGSYKLARRPRKQAEQLAQKYGRQ